VTIAGRVRDTMTSADLTGPSTRSSLARIVLKGNSYERGLQYGRQFGPCLERFYRWFVRRDPEELLTGAYLDALERMEGMAAEHFPQLLEQLKGWSDGAKLSHDTCRIMAFHNEISNVLRPGCSNILVTQGGEGPWLARNCDLSEAERSWQVQMISHCDDCHSSASIGYLGLPHGIGVNQAGLAIGGSSLPAERRVSLKGMPTMAAALLSTQGSVAECVGRIEALGHLGKGVNLALLDASGEGAVLALGGGETHAYRPGEQGFLVATNHSIDGKTKCPAGVSPAYLESSRARYARLTRILSAARQAERTPDLGRKALADMQGKWSVCEHVPGGFHTIYAWVIQPGRDRTRMDLCWGYPCQNAFEPVDLDW
jgi:hypothetical protein